MVSRVMKWTTAFALLAVVVTTVGCSTDPPPPTGVPDEHLALYEMIHAYRRDHEDALALIVSGDEIAGRNLLAAATDRLAVAAEVCSTRSSCEMALFTDAGIRALQNRMAVEIPPTGSVTDAVPEIGRTVTLLNGRDLRELIPMNPRVQAALNDWLTWNRPALMNAYDNYQFLRERVAPVYEEAGLPEALLFGMMAKETGVKAHSYSRAGAAGPLQFMGRTARRYGLGMDNGFDMRLDAVAATRANVAYLDDLFRVFNNDLEKAIAAYNVGDGRLRRLERKHDGAGFWEPELYYALPSETRDYVPQVFAAALLFLHPEEYGLVLPEYETTLTTVTLVEDAALDELTICLGQENNPDGWFRTLRNLNPRADPSERLPAGSPIEMPSIVVPLYVERCLGDSALRSLGRELHDATYPDRPEWLNYTVRTGDTLAEIAARHPCTSVPKLADLNGIHSPDYVIHPGQRITVPGCG